MAWITPVKLTTYPKCGPKSSKYQALITINFLDMFLHQEFQVPKMEGFLNLTRLFFLGGSPLHKPYPYSLNNLNRWVFPPLICCFSSSGLPDWWRDFGQAVSHLSRWFWNVGRGISNYPLNKSRVISDTMERQSGLELHHPPVLQIEIYTTVVELITSLAQGHLPSGKLTWQWKMNRLLEDVFPIENGDVPLLCLFTGV